MVCNEEMLKNALIYLTTHSITIACDCRDLSFIKDERESFKLENHEFTRRRVWAFEGLCDKIDGKFHLKLHEIFSLVSNAANFSYFFIARWKCHPRASTVIIASLNWISEWNLMRENLINWMNLNQFSSLWWNFKDFLFVKIFFI